MCMPVTTSMPGMNSMVPPNVCKVPMPAPVPTPLPSMGLTTTTIPATQAFKIFTVGCPTSHVGSVGMTLPVDVAGIGLGNTGTVTGTQTTQMGATRIFSMGTPTAIMTSMHGMNTTNTIGLTALPSQPKVFCCP